VFCFFAHSKRLELNVGSKAFRSDFQAFKPFFFPFSNVQVEINGSTAGVQHFFEILILFFSPSTLISKEMFVLHLNRVVDVGSWFADFHQPKPKWATGGNQS